MADGPMQEVFADGDDIQHVIEALEPVLMGRPRAHVVMALLSLTMSTMNPEITEEQLVAGVRGASEWICLFLTTTQAQVEVDALGEVVPKKVTLN